jgi:mitogen-activated protein kinase organizer 1
MLCVIVYIEWVRFKGHKHNEYKIESILSNKDEYAITGSEDGKIYIYDILEGNIMSTIEAHQGVSTSIDYHPENVNMVSAGSDGLIHVWS